MTARCAGLLFLALLAACQDLALPSCGGSTAPAAAPSTASALPPAIQALGALAQPTAIQASGSLAPAGGAIPLADGAMLTSAPGALAAPVALTVRRVDLALPLIDFRLERSTAYVIESGTDVPRFGASVALQLAQRPERVIVSRLEGSQWIRMPLAPGPVARVELAHFSGNTVVVHEPWVEQLTPVRAETPQGRNESNLLNRTGNPAAVLFFGMGETQRATSRELCNELEAVLAAPGLNYGYPPGEAWHNVNPVTWASRNLTLAGYLHSNAVPESLGGHYWDLTADHMGDIQRRLLAATTPVTPAGMFRICIDSYGGNVPMAVLGCHNFLKNVTEKGRYAPIAEVPEELGEVASHLQTWRGTDRTRAGQYDKMGPLYHVFATMTAGVWAMNSVGADAAAYIELVLRATGAQGDPEDPDKESADHCGRDLAHTIRGAAGAQALTGPPAGVPGVAPAPPEALPPVTPVVVGDGGLRQDGAIAGPDGGQAEEPDAAAAEAHAFDAGPAPPTEVQTWDGRYQGHIRFTSRSALGGDTVIDAVMTLTLRRIGNEVLMSAPGSADEHLQLTPSNPNAAVGRGPLSLTVGAVANASGEFATTLFLRAGRLYFARHIEVTGAAHLGSSSAEDHNVTDIIGILDPVR